MINNYKDLIEHHKLIIKEYGLDQYIMMNLNTLNKIEITRNKLHELKQIIENCKHADILNEINDIIYLLCVEYGKED